MTITRVTEVCFPQAVAVYREAWRESHYGTMLLRFAMEQCGSAKLTVLSSNTRALTWYERIGFVQTGQRRQLRDGLWEVELGFGELP